MGHESGVTKADIIGKFLGIDLSGYRVEGNNIIDDGEVTFYRADGDAADGCRQLSSYTLEDTGQLKTLIARTCPSSGWDNPLIFDDGKEAIDIVKTRVVLAALGEKINDNNFLSKHAKEIQGLKKRLNKAP